MRGTGDYDKCLDELDRVIGKANLQIGTTKVKEKPEAIVGFLSVIERAVETKAKIQGFIE